MTTLDTIVSDLSDLRVSQLIELSKRLQDEWGVSLDTFTNPAFVVDEMPTQADDEAQTEFTVRLKEIGPRKIEVIKAIRELRPELSLVEAKALVEATPTDIMADVMRDKADEVATRLRKTDATIEIY